MLVATHMLAASALYKLSSASRMSGIGKAAALPVALAFSFCSHFALDAVPHDELQMTGNVLLGIAVILFLFYAAWRDRDIFLLAAAFLGALPDIMWVLQISPAYDAIHSSLHFKGGTVPPYLLGLEFVEMLLLLYINYEPIRQK